MPRRNDPVISVRLAGKLLEKLEAYAKSRGISRNRAILEAIVALISSGKGGQ